MTELDRQQEEWRTIKDYPDYAVSNMGRVKRVTDSRRQYRAGLILKPHIGTRGYPLQMLYRHSKPTNNLIHRLVLETFVGLCPYGCECNHKDGVKTNNSVDNLEWVTHAENEKHAYRIGLKIQGAGDDCQNSKLKSGEVWLIKKL